MRIVELVQGSAEWHAHRAQHFNASDAPAMLGVSPHVSRSRLLRDVKTCLTADPSTFQERIFNAGHRYEALARPLAEAIVGDELFPCVGVLEGTKLSASFDGITMLGDVVFEHKTLNDDLREAIARANEHGEALPEPHRVQMEQQLLVSGASRALFMASKWDADGNLVDEAHCGYSPDAALRQRIVAGWAQFEADLAALEPEPAAKPVATGRTPEALPALRIEVTGMVTASNLAEFKSHALAVLGSINRDLRTDDDFADAEQTVKWCKAVEDRLEAAKVHALSQTASIEELFRTVDDIAAETRRVRLDLDRLVKAEKDARRSEIVERGRHTVADHYRTINATLGEHAIHPPQTLSFELANAIKGKRTLTSITEAIEAAVATAKIAASQRAEQVRACMAVLGEVARGHETLFADRVVLCESKTPDDLRNLVAARIAEHERCEQERREAERERIRVEEETRARQAIEREQREAAALTSTALPGQAQAAPANVAPSPAAALVEAPEPSAALVKLGTLATRIAPLSITAEGLASLGFHPVGTDRTAKLYAAEAFPAMCEAMAGVLRDAARRAANERRAA